MDGPFFGMGNGGAKVVKSNKSRIQSKLESLDKGGYFYPGKDKKPPSVGGLKTSFYLVKEGASLNNSDNDKSISDSSMYKDKDALKKNIVCLRKDNCIGRDN